MFFEDFEVGTQRESSGRTITEADMVLHAGQTGDFYPHHMDAEWCRTQPFGQRMAHGTLVFSVGVGITAGADQSAGYELWIRSAALCEAGVFGDTIRVKVAIKEKRDDAKRASTGHCG